MSEESSQPQYSETIRNFTAARRFPQLIGKTPDGKRIAGGPYTMTQFVGGGLLILGLYFTYGIWFHLLGLTGSVTFVLVVVVGGVIALGRIRPGGRSPLSVAHGLLNASRGSTQGVTTADVSRMRAPRPQGRAREVRASVYIWPSAPNKTN